jgi:hypothetical protein
MTDPVSGRSCVVGQVANLRPIANRPCPKEYTA